MNDLDRVLPNNLEAERAVLGAILLHPPALFEACESLNKADFYTTAHRKIFDVFLRLQAAETGIDQVTVCSELRKAGELEECGGAPYIMTLTDGLPRAVNVRHYGAIIREQAMLRHIIQLGTEAVESSYAAEDSAKDIVSNLQLALIKLTESAHHGGWRKISDLVGEAYKEIEELANRKLSVTGIDTGYPDLNALTQGFHPGQLIVIAGRPGHGKTSLGLNLIANAILRQNKRVGLFTIEMSAMEITKRIICAEAEVDSHRVGTGYVNKEDWGRIAKAAEFLAESNLSVDESGSLTIMELRSRAQQLAVAGGLDMLVVDYLQLMAGPGGRNDRNRVQEISDISRGLKSLAKDMNIPIIAMSQLNRQVENEQKRKPRLADLRESGSIEQDADVVLFIWREELRARTDENIGQAELIIGKQRNGPVGETVSLTFLKQFTKFVPGARTRAGSYQPDMWYQRE